MVAPMARRVSYAEEDGLVFCPRLSKCFIAPWIPVNWIVRVLNKVRTLLVNQMVRVLRPLESSGFVFILSNAFTNREKSTVESLLNH